MMNEESGVLERINELIAIIEFEVLDQRFLGRGDNKSLDPPSEVGGLDHRLLVLLRNGCGLSAAEY